MVGVFAGGQLCGVGLRVWSGLDVGLCRRVERAGGAGAGGGGGLGSQWGGHLWHRLAGAGATASAVTHGALDAQHELLAAALVDKACHVVAAAGAHQSALASMVTAEEAGANRVDEAAAQQLNPLVWGALTPQIVALNVEYYGQMWPHNAAAGAAYGAALRAAAAAIMVPFPPAVPGASLAAAGVGLAEAGAMSAAGATVRASEQAAHAVLTPAAAAPQGGAGARGGAASLAGSAVPSAAPNAASVAGTPTAAQTVHPAPQAAVGMFARISPAGVVGAPTGAPPAGEGPASAQLAEALQSRAGALTPPGSELGPGGSAVIRVPVSPATFGPRRRFCPTTGRAGPAAAHPRACSTRPRWAARSSPPA